mgnify:FL=1
MQQEKTKHNPINWKEPFYKVMYLYVGVLCFCGVVGCLIGSVASDKYYIVYGALINVPFIIIAVVLNVVFNYMITAFAAQGGKKGSLTAVAIFLNILKYFIAIMGLIIGVIVDVTTSDDIFNIYSMMGCAFIYPVGSLISSIHISVIERKKDKAKKKKVLDKASSYIVKEENETN